MVINNEILSIILVLYNKIEKPLIAIDSIVNSHLENLNINLILIDNSEKPIIDKIILKIENQLNKKQLKLFQITNYNNKGFSKAVNEGINLALMNKTKYILLLNDDAYIHKYCINYLIKELKKNPKALLAGPTIFYYQHPNKVWHTGGYFNKFLSKIHIPYKNKNIPFDFFKKLPVKRVDFLTGCVLMLKAEAIDKIGYFDEDLFFYGEDLDYSLRVKKAGYNLLWVPYSFAWHDINIKTGRTSSFIMYHLARSNLILRKKNFTKIYFYYYFLIHSLLLTPFRVYQILRGSKNLKSIYAWFKGTIDGLSWKI